MGLEPTTFSLGTAPDPKRTITDGGEEERTSEDTVTASDETEGATCDRDPDT